MAIRVLIVHRNPIYRTGLQMLLEQADTLEVVGEEIKWETLGVLLQSQRPDVVLLDGSIDGALELTTLLRSQHCRVFVLVQHVDEETCFHFFKHGAVAYELDMMDAGELVEKVRRVARGECLIDSIVFAPRSAVRLPEAHVEMPVPQEEPNRPYLTSREIAVLCLAARGYSNVMIGRALEITDQTVKNHISSILLKFDVFDRTSAVVTALLYHVISLEEIGLHEMVKKQKRIVSSPASENGILVNS